MSAEAVERVKAVWWLTEEEVPLIDIILDGQVFTVTKEDARELASQIRGCMGGIIEEFARWRVLDSWGKKRHLVQKDRYDERGPAICGARPNVRFTETWRDEHPLASDLDEREHGFCKRCLAAYKKVEAAR